MGRALAVAVGTALCAGCSADHGKSDPAKESAATRIASVSPSPTPTKKYSAVGSWTPIFLSDTNMFTFEVKKNGDVSTFGEPVARNVTQDSMVLCSGELASMSLPTTVKLNCLDTGELTETARPGAGDLKLPEYKGLVDVVGEVPETLKEYGSLKKYGRELLMIKWTGGQVDLLYKGTYGGGSL
ncbi:hypothetical protein ACF1AE_32505 [Streptomyces sp. NPDC014986]|uniref:hypothetical protein n=1 Tax=Streptomyces sp. NPDC014986 TaxID=3364934 RepID=UPI0036FB2831